MKENKWGRIIKLQDLDKRTTIYKMAYFYLIEGGRDHYNTVQTLKGDKFEKITIIK